MPTCAKIIFKISPSLKMLPSRFRFSALALRAGEGARSRTGRTVEGTRRTDSHRRGKRSQILTQMYEHEHATDTPADTFIICFLPFSSACLNAA